MFRYPEADHPFGSLRHLDSVPVLRVTGTPEQMGAAVGALAVRPALRMTTYPEEVLRHYWAGWLRRPLLWLGERMLRRLPPERLLELEAMALTAGVDRQRFVLGNTLFDQKKILACAAFMVEAGRSATGGPLFGRNLDYPSLNYAHEYSLVTVYRGVGKKTFATVGFPGLLGALSGMNEDGLSLGVLEVFQSRLFSRRVDRGGTPYAICFRTLLEECSTVDEARQRLEKMRRSTLFNLAICDRQRAAVLESTVKGVRERQAVAGACLCTNHFQIAGHRPTWGLNVYKTFDRLRAMQQVEQRLDQFDVADVHGAMHAVHQGDHTLQTMVFEPAQLRLHIALGAVPATAGPLRTLPLRDLLVSHARAG